MPPPVTTNPLPGPAPGGPMHRAAVHLEAHAVTAAAHRADRTVRAAAPAMLPTERETADVARVDAETWAHRATTGAVAGLFPTPATSLALAWAAAATVQTFADRATARTAA